MNIVTQDIDAETTDLLIAQGMLAADAAAHAKRVQKGSTERLDTLLVKLGLVRDEDFARAMARHLRLPLISKLEYPQAAILNDVLTPRFLKDSRVLPISEEPDGLVLAMANPLDKSALRSVEYVIGRKVLPVVGIAGEIDEAFTRLYVQETQPGTVAQQRDEEGVEVDVERLRDLASEAPVVRLVNNLITRAVEMRASDIHFEPLETGLRVRTRVDGALLDIERLPATGQRAAIISRIKILAQLNIAERRLPQDGRVRIAVRGAPIDIRVSTYPTMHGEAAVLRILDRSQVELDFAALGISGPNFEKIDRMIQQPHGIVLVTGPTGSGKTTTLYASLKRLNRSDRKLVTIEDPIEYELEGVNQIQVRFNIGLNFATMLRSILRADPDIIMVGEIRDLETAEVAAQAALTGHLVLSTLHTNDAASSITRLLDMGVEDYLIASTVTGVVAQRLVRLLCPACKQPNKPVTELAHEFHIEDYARADSSQFTYRAVGCERCNRTGFSGRSSILEVLPMSEELRAMVLKRADAQQLQKQAVREHMQTMLWDGLDKVAAGLTTVDEVLRVTRVQ